MNNKYYEFFCLVKVIVGKFVLEYIFYELIGLFVKCLMIVMDKGVCVVGLFELVIVVCEESGLEIVSIYDDVLFDLLIMVVCDIVGIYCQEKCDFIIVVGGGFVIDIGKVVNILVLEGGDDIVKYSGVGVIKYFLKLFFVVLIMVGIGFEVIVVVVIIDEVKGVKFFFILLFLLFNVVIIDLWMILMLFFYIIVVIVMDVMIYVVEVFICMVKNLFSDVYVMVVIKKVSQLFLIVMDNFKNIDGCFELV